MTVRATFFSATVPRRGMRRGLWAVCALGFAALLAIVWHRNEAFDLYPVWRATSAFLHGGHPYRVPLYVYPPSALVIFAPLGAFGWEAARAVFLAVDTVALAIGAVIALRLAGVDRRSLLAPMICAAIVLYYPVGFTLRLENVNGLVFAAECAAFLFAARRRWELSGVMFGLALAVKPVLTPLLLVPLLWRQWRAAAIAVAVAIGISLVGIALSQGRSEFFTITVPFLVKGNAAYLQAYNVSLKGAADLFGVSSVLAAAARVAVLGAAAYLCALRLQRDDDGAARIVDVSGLILVATFLVFSFSWNHYAIYLLPMLLLSVLGRSLLPRWAALGACVFIGLPDQWYFWRHAHAIAAKLMAGRVVLGLLLLLAGFAWALVGTGRRRAERDHGPGIARPPPAGVGSFTDPHRPKGGPMSRADVDRDIEETLGLVPTFFQHVPDYLIESEWQSFKALQLSDDTAIPNKYKELIGLAVSGATRCRYCAYFHTEAAKLFGATDEEVTEASLVAKNTMAWSTYLNAMQFDYDEFVEEFDRITEYVRSQMAVPAGAPA
jgi:AhpD family alkylhydroperoxidase